MSPLRPMPHGLVYGSVCSGIEAASVAWHPLGWRAAFLSEIEPFPRAVLAHHYPTTSLHGDFTTIQAGDYDPIDVLVGGTPCQSFSIAGLRGGLDDERGNLALEYLRLADRLRPNWLLWENVPGVLSSNGGRDFGAFLGGLGQLGYGFAYRVLDAQFFGLAQRRKRVFVVGHLGDWRRAAAVLFEPASLRRDTPPRRQAGRDAAGTLSARTSAGGGLGTDFECAGGIVARPLTANKAGGSGGQRYDWETETLVTHSLRGEGFDASEDGTGRGTPLVPCQPYTLAIRGRGDGHNLEYRQDGVANALLTPNGGRGGTGCGAIALPLQEVGKRTGVSTDDRRAGIGIGQYGDPMFTLQAGAQHGVVLKAEVRRLTPRECERLQGFPDDYTAVPYRGKPAADVPRYRALGNSMAVPCMAWIGKRIAVQHAEVAA